MNRQSHGKQESSVSGEANQLLAVDSPHGGNQEKFRPLSQPSSQQYESMAVGGLLKHASVPSAQPEMTLQSKWGRTHKDAMFEQPDDKHVVY